MRTPTLVLSLTTVFFAATTAYLAIERSDRDIAESRGSPTAATDSAARAEAGAAGARLDSAAADARGATRDPLRTDEAGTTLASMSPPVPVPGAASERGFPDLNVIIAREQLAKLTDPVQRAALLVDTRSTLRRQYAPLRDRLALPAATFEQMIDMLAESALETQETYTRCAVDPACIQEENWKRHPPNDRSQEMLALLGAEKTETFNKYQSSLAERDSVAQLRGRLSETNSMRDLQAESLVVALADERERYQKEIEARGSQPMGWGTNLGTVYYSSDSNSIEQRLAESAEYSQRLRSRASTVLTPAQLAAFNQLQDELLAQMATFLRPASVNDKQRV